jgi:hypothetical protein
MMNMLDDYKVGEDNREDNIPLDLCIGFFFQRAH